MIRAASTGTTPPALEIADLSVLRKGPGGVQIPVLQNVNLSVAPGECLAIVGASGSGKSVLARTLLGLTDPSGGHRWRVDARTFTVAGHDMRRASQRAWRALRGSAIALVLQDALQSLDPLRTIGAEVSEAIELRGASLRVRREATLAALTTAGLKNPETLLRLRSDALSGGMRQRALIASALISKPSVLVADEPTTALDPATAHHVLDEFSRIRDSGASLIVVSHDLAAVARIADRIAVLESGRIVEVDDADVVLNSPTHPVTQSLVAAIPVSGESAPAGAIPAGEVVAEFTGATRNFGERAGKFLGVQEVNLTVRRGEVLGIAGGSGEGKTTLARILAGAEQLDSGSLQLRRDARVRLIPQDPLSTFDPRWTVRRILAATIRRGAQTGDAPSPESFLRRVGLDAQIANRFPSTLSGGERQRVAIARALAASPTILVCDEAVSALDTVTQAGVLDLLRSLRSEVAIVFISHDLGALREICNRIIVMREGRLVSQSEAEDFTRR
ncbi:MAG: ABC transporter ATP-binding protein [Leucobacter sp.]